MKLFASKLRRRALLAAGGATLVLGLFLVSAAVYEIAAQGGETTSVQSVILVPRDRPGAIFDGLPATPTPSLPPPSPAPVAIGGAPGRAPLRDSPYRMIIGKIGVNAPVVTYGLDRNRVPQVPLNAYDVAWYDFSAQPGAGGNAVFAGHVTWSGRAVFYRLDALAQGDQILLRGNDGRELLYTVTDVLLVAPDDPNSLSLMSPTTTDVVTIITCGGTFFYTGDPVYNGDYTNRLVVRAALTGLNAVGAAEAPASGG